MLNIFRFCFLSIVAALSMLMLSPVAAENNNAYTLHYSDRALAQLGQFRDRGGLSPEQLGRWLVRNGSLTLETGGRAGRSAKLMLLLVDGSGEIHAEDAVTFRASPGRQRLGDVVDAADIGDRLAKLSTDGSSAPRIRQPGGFR